MGTLPRKKTLQTLAVLAAALLVLCLVLRRPAPAALAAALLLLPFVSPRAASAVALTWLKFGELLGRFNTSLLLGLVYFLVLTPLALISRLAGAGRSGLKFDPAAASYFKERSGVFVPAGLEKPW